MSLLVAEQMVRRVPNVVVQVTNQRQSKHVLPAFQPKRLHTNTFPR